MANELIPLSQNAKLPLGSIQDYVAGNKIEGDQFNATNAVQNVTGAQPTVNNKIAKAEINLPTNLTPIQRLLQKLDNEVKENTQIQGKLSCLECWYDNHSVDGIDGLVKKLNHAGREAQITRALRFKESFVKVLDEWSLYPSAQRILGRCLADAEGEYNDYIHPLVEELPLETIDRLVTERIVIPISDQFGGGELDMDRRTTTGMVYWLAEQCHIRWHK
ncbi:hypothetical protein FZ983_30160 [Azospirillum sp. B21]|uniref:ABC-three component system protein n=1 Tax=Azospirillum sp. B21 TaxID=2607496 RepID=UPI0011EFBA72|nr:ABC-three component system protein [Azospirillum sp. B21]KAA0573285.1 hypothetical protein FZ983_30160 [Azospirillum sp. B21]